VGLHKLFFRVCGGAVIGQCTHRWLLRLGLFRIFGWCEYQQVGLLTAFSCTRVCCIHAREEGGFGARHLLRAWRTSKIDKITSLSRSKQLEVMTILRKCNISLRMFHGLYCVILSDTLEETSTTTNKLATAANWPVGKTRLCQVRCVFSNSNISPLILVTEKKIRHKAYLLNSRCTFKYTYKESNAHKAIFLMSSVSWKRCTL